MGSGLRACLRACKPARTHARTASSQLHKVGRQLGGAVAGLAPARGPRAEPSEEAVGALQLPLLDLVLLQSARAELPDALEAAAELVEHVVPLALAEQPPRAVHTGHGEAAHLLRRQSEVHSRVGGVAPVHQVKDEATLIAKQPHTPIEGVAQLLHEGQVLAEALVRVRELQGHLPQVHEGKAVAVHAACDVLLSDLREFHGVLPRVEITPLEVQQI
mmetsp:Transcript_83433/g.259121  ORF Transcript_83433/g.259121 Transcript_83433/m.259121 type:complete len:217 (+) Transcript_83433:17-667(+)